jgi:hypothetical protein
MYLLPVTKYYLIENELKKISFNTLFARVVVEQKVKGIVYVDNIENPTVYYVVHPYGMSLLFGKHDNYFFNLELQKYLLNFNLKRNKPEWLQVGSTEWKESLEVILGGDLVEENDSFELESSKVVKHKRLNFKFSLDKFNRQFKKHSNHQKLIVKTTKQIYENLKGSVIPSKFWDSFEDFDKEGIGFSLVKNGDPVSTAFTSFTIENLVEIGIQTKEGFQGLNYGYSVCQQLIDFCSFYCLEPVWSCNANNIASKKLALKLGFDEILELPYYKLPYVLYS